MDDLAVEAVIASASEATTLEAIDGWPSADEEKAADVVDVPATDLAVAEAGAAPTAAIAVAVGIVLVVVAAEVAAAEAVEVAAFDLTVIAVTDAAPATIDVAA